MFRLLSAYRESLARPRRFRRRHFQNVFFKKPLNSWMFASDVSSNAIKYL